VLVAGAALVGLGVLMLVARLMSVSVDADLAQDYFAAQALLHHQTIYNPAFFNNHPPFAIMLAVPLAWLSFDQAFLVWSAISLLCYAVVVWLVYRELDLKLAGYWRLLLVGLALCWFPFQGHMALGQWSLLITACLVGCWALLRQDRPGLAGVLLGIACLVKLFPGLILIYLLLRRSWRAAAAAGTVCVIGGSLTLMVVGWSDTLAFFADVGSANLAAVGAFPVNASITGAVGRLLLDGRWVRPLVAAPSLAEWLIGLVSLGLLLVLVWQTRRSSTTQLGNDKTFAAACIAMLLVSPLTWQHMFPLLILPLGLLLRDVLGRASWQAGALVVLATLSVSLPDLEIARVLMAPYQPARMPWFAALPLLAPTVGLLLMWRLLSKIRPVSR
jgi:hypothetical protein